MELGTLIKKYYQNKRELDGYKKICEEDKNAIKNVMLSDNLETFKSGDLVASCKTITSESFDDDKLITKLKTVWKEQSGSKKCPWVKTIEMPDMEAIENAIYDGLIKPDDLKSCKVKKQQVRLTVSKVKENKNDNE